MKIRGIAKEEKIPIFDDLTQGTKTHKLCYGKEGYFHMNFKELNEHRRNPRTSPYILIPRNSKTDRYKSLKEMYDEFQINAPLLKTITEDKINLWKSGSWPKTALKIFNDLNTIEDTDTITPDEINYIESCYNGALIWGKPFKGIAYKYDIVSQYPSIMRSEHMNFPIKEGKLITLKNEDLKFYKYGIYSNRAAMD